VGESERAREIAKLREKSERANEKATDERVSTHRSGFVSSILI